MTRTFEVTGKETKYKNPWMEVQEYTIRRDGTPGIYGVVERQDSTTIILSTPDGRILFVKQYRFPTQSHSWELPMGGVDAGEAADQAARRELVEETGYSAAAVTAIGTFRPIPGLTPQLVTVFKVTAPNEIAQRLESFDGPADEIVSRRLLSRQEIRSMIASGEISDGFTLCSLAVMEFQD